MKKYTDLSFVETAQALEDGKNVEWYCTDLHTWALKTDKNVYGSTKYRRVEEVEDEWTAEIGEPVLVKTAGSPFKDFGCIYRGMFEGKFITEDISGMLNGWDEIAPIKKEKREPRVIYVLESGGGQLAGNHFCSNPNGSRIKFVEEIEE